MPLFSKKDSKPSSLLIPSSASDNLSNPSPAATLAIPSTAISGRPEEVFGRQFVANTTTDNRADQINDALARVTNVYQHGDAMYATNKSLIDDAWQAMETATGVGRAMDDWIGPINKVMDGLLGLAKAQPFPFVELAVTLFNGVVKLELQRRQNSTRARALILQMADMMGALLQLHFVEDPTLITDNGDSVQGRIQNLMRDIEQDINSTGNLINKYHQHSLASKFFRSGQYATQFKSAADALLSRKGDIQYACTIHTTVTVDEIRKQVRETNTMILKLTAIIEHHSEKEKQWEQTMQQYGGRNRVLENPEVTMEVAAIIEGRSKTSTTIPQTGSDKTTRTEGASSKAQGANAVRTAVLANGEVAFSRKELLELAQPLEKVLQDSLPYYENKLMAQVQSIKNDINKSTQKILSRLEEGSHEKIVHGDIRQVWRDNGWRSSVKARTFVMGLHDYYLDRYAMAVAKSSTISTTTAATTTTTAMATLTVTVQDVDFESRPASPIDSIGSPLLPTIGGLEDGGLSKKQVQVASDESILADKDYLEYLTMPYVNAIAEAIDEDASGFVRISEANDFCASIPPGWTLLQWIAYWARGWIVESAYYAFEIWDIYRFANVMLSSALTENCNGVFQYLDNLMWVIPMKQLTWCAATKSTWRTDSPLDDLIKTRMQQKEDRLEASLESFDFTFDSMESVKLVMDPGRFEKDIFSLFFVMSRRHIRLISLAAEEILSESDMWNAQDSMLYLTAAIKERVERLRADFKHQGIDEDNAMSRIAGGVYEALHSNSLGDLPKPYYPEEDSDRLWITLLPSGLDLHKFGNFDLSYDVSAYEVAASGVSSRNSSATTIAEDVPETAVYHSPLVVPKGLEFVQLVVERSGDLSTIRKEITAFSGRLKDQLMRRRLRHPALVLLELIGEVEIETQLDSKLGAEFFTSSVQLLCALAELPDIEDDHAPLGLHDGFMANLGDAFEVICIDLSYAIRLYKEYQTAHRVIPSSAGDEVELSHSTVPKVEPLPISLALSEAISRTSHLAPIIKAVIDAHTSTGARRFRAAAEIVLNEIRDRHYRASWKSMERRRDLRKIFVAAQAKKMMFDEANQWWGALPGTEETYNRFSALLREIAEIDRPLFRSLSRQEYRGEIVHISRNCDACKRLVVGTRYTCLLCKDFDLCEACSGLRHKDLTNAHGKLHHDWHPMIRLPRPTVEIWERDIDSFLTIYERLSRGEAHSSEALAKGLWSVDPDNDDSDEGEGEASTKEGYQWNNEQDGSKSEPTIEDDHGAETSRTFSRELAIEAGEVDSGKPAGGVASGNFTAADNDGAATEQVTTHEYSCANCKRTKSGVRFVTLPQYDCLQYCPECDTSLSIPEGNKPLPRPFQQMLKVILPRDWTDDDATTVSDDEREQEETAQEKMAKHLASLDQRLSAQELKISAIDERMQGLEFKLDMILQLLTTAPSSSAPPTTIIISGTPENQQYDHEP